MCRIVFALPLTGHFVNTIMRTGLHLRQKLGLVPLQSLQSVQEEGGFSESQEASYVGGCQGHHLTVLVEHLWKGEGKLCFSGQHSG